MHSTTAVSLPQEHVIVSTTTTDPHLWKSLEYFCQLRPHVQIHQVSQKSKELIWTSFRNGLQIDSTILEPKYLGKHLQNETETAQAWNNLITTRSEMLRLTPQLGAGGNCKKS